MFEDVYYASKISQGTKQLHQFKQAQPWGSVHGAKHLWNNDTHQTLGQLLHLRLRGTTMAVFSGPASPPALCPYTLSRFKLSSCSAGGIKMSALPLQNLCQQEALYWRSTAKCQFNRKTKLQT